MKRRHLWRFQIEKNPLVSIVYTKCVSVVRVSQYVCCFTLAQLYVWHISQQVSLFMIMYAYLTILALETRVARIAIPVDQGVRDNPRTKSTSPSPTWWVSSNIIMQLAPLIRQKPGVNPMVVEWWVNAADRDPTFHQHWVNILCLLPIGTVFSRDLSI